jgi:hypothetical protein
MDVQTVSTRLDRMTCVLDVDQRARCMTVKIPRYMTARGVASPPRLLTLLLDALEQIVDLVLLLIRDHALLPLLLLLLLLS